MEVSVTSKTKWAISNGKYVDYGEMGEDSGVSERLSHFCEPVNLKKPWGKVHLPETEDELAEILSTLV